MVDSILFLAANDKNNKFNSSEAYSFEQPDLARKRLQMIGDGDGGAKGIDFSVTFTDNNDLQAHGPIQYCNVYPLPSTLNAVKPLLFVLFLPSFCPGVVFVRVMPPSFG